MKGSPNFLLILLETRCHGFHSQPSRIKLYSNGHVVINLKSHGIFEHVNEKFMDILLNENNKYNYFEGKLSVNNLNARCLYQMKLNHEIDLGKLSNVDNKIIRCKVRDDKNNEHPMYQIVNFYFIMGARYAYAKFHSNGNIYIYMHLLSHFNNQKNNLSDIFQVIKNLNF
jgi:hypothetical protein